MTDFNLICLTIVSISAMHTFSGPDHYLPFIVLSRSKKWRLSKTIFWTCLCGFAHVLSSVVLGILGIFLGVTVSKIFHIETIRGGFAAWLLLIFGVVYIFYAFYKLRKNKIHKHFNVSEEGDIYVFEHQHGQSVLPKKNYKVTPWVMFFIFALGPSEPLIPLIIYPYINYSFIEIGILITLYTFTTVFMMLSLVLLGFYGSKLINYQGFEKHIDLISGLAITICGIGMVFLEW
ncbi:hypothetical protein [Flavivirga jejuensis]|uniref:Cytochrome C biogenesis DsbD-like protein n=1 Tax=Flavivirga jejuensis TaxID=870487 RepID=A0ABT8WKP1_9FLAO|nr:hypothetical protein [Flavivirga jejuensis]MDO5973630.1 hypothetical protein [Flavivirga jejuensis]